MAAAASPSPQTADLPPAVPTALEVALWFEERAGPQPLPRRKLHCLLYLAQAYFAAAQGGRRLMPAAFLAEAEGPVEPGVALTLECGLACRPVPRIPPRIEAVLAALWQQYGPVPGAGLARLIAADGVWRACREANPGGLIPLIRLHEAYGASLAALKEPGLAENNRPAEAKRASAMFSPPGSPAEEPSAGAAIEAVLADARAAAGLAAGSPVPTAASPSPKDPPSKLPPVARPQFTLDGRPITPWAPRRRLPAD